MNTKRYIKVTPKDGGKPQVMTAENTDFYRARGCVIETPTEEEIYAHFPELKENHDTGSAPAAGETVSAAEYNALKDKYHTLEVENDVLKQQIAKLKEKASKSRAGKGKAEGESAKTED